MSTESGKGRGIAPGAINEQLRSRLANHWKAYAFQGAVLTILGICAIAAPLAATLASTLFFGWLLIIGGVIGGAASFQAFGHSGFWSSFALSVLAVLLGAVIVYDPFAGAVTLTWMMGVYFVLTAVFQFQLAGHLREGGKGGLILSAVINLLLAAILVIGLPGTAVWAIGMYLGVSLLFSGVSLFFAAIGARNAQRIR
ncbi:HdeD family acid-resistance protein [Aureimonas frigidaquae]|uniref:HdeD family acid-resistance protein n=1 Tax=Aureimonas frigidaquae TaxID=424757 RepID=A0A0P0Z3K4_9HYPH|nr:HdeD family acid-resistance protein [Aureimonas frigidaquae]BAT28688.1 hypothetical protein [Aureimonas frigidaquae]